MRKFVISTVVLLLSLTSSAGYADGLFHRLPEDGASVSYKIEMTIVHGGESKAGNGTLRVSSVGQTTVDDEKCRWIEFKWEMKMDGREQTIIYKVLIPEKHFGNGKTPIDHVKKCWLKAGEREARKIEDVRGTPGGPLPVFLSGPLKDVKKLKQETIDTKLGKLSCEGSTGRLEFKQGKIEIVADLETRLHGKAPFGVVTSKMKVKISGQGPQQDITMTLKLTDVGKNAKTELPDAN